MRKSAIFLLLTILCTYAMHGQETRRTWNMGPLTWNDFTVVNHARSSNTDEHSFLEFVYDIKTAARPNNGITSGEPEAVAYTVKKKSWVDSAYCSPAELRYNQVLFNLVELYRRQLQQWINSDTYFNEELLLDSIMQIAIDSVDQYCFETTYGFDTLIVNEWDRRITAALQRTDSAAARSRTAVQSKYTYIDDPLRLGASLLMGFMGTGGELHQYISHGFGMGMDFEVGIKRHFLLCGFNIGGAKCLKDAYNVHDPIDDLYKDDALTILNGSIGYGFSAIDRAKLRVTPFVGWGGIGYFYTEEGADEDETNSFGSSNGCFHFGINTQYHFQNTIFGSTHDRYSVDLKLFGTYNRFRTIQQTPTGFTFNIQVGISVLTGEVSKKMVESN